MIPNKELQELARALINSSEYTEMMKARKRVLDNSGLGRRMLTFEKEQSRIVSSNAAVSTVTEQLNKLHEEYKDFLNESDVKSYISASNTCQNMIDSCFITLNKSLEIHNNGR